MEHADISSGTSHLFSLTVKSVSFDKPRTLNGCANICQRMIPVSFSRVNTVQARALICLNNIVSALDTGLLGGQEVLAQLWTSLFSLTFESKGMLNCRS
mgnify:CR=1 FL=1